MTIQTFSCPSCTAPIQYDGSGSMVACAYCDTNVIVPEVLRAQRAAPPHERATVPVSRPALRTEPQQPKFRSGCVWIGIGLAFAGILIAGIAGWMTFAVSAPAVQFATDSAETLTASVTESSSLATRRVATATPGFASAAFAFGSAGVGAGRFDDARGIALDQNGHVYVGEYSTGRIQVFDESGKFITQWIMPGSPYLDHFAVSREGVLVAPGGGELQQFEAQSGRSLGPLPLGESPNVDDSVVALADGGWLLLMGDDIVRVNSAGEEVLRIVDAIRSASGESEMIPVVTADGVGNIYALGRMRQIVYKFAPDGRFLTRFGGSTSAAVNAPGSLQAASSIAVDGLGRVYVGDIFGIKIFDSEGRFLDAIDTDGFPFGLAFHDNGSLYAVEREHVSVYTIHE